MSVSLRTLVEPLSPPSIRNPPPMTPDQQNTSKGRWMFVPDGWKVMPISPPSEIIEAMSRSRSADFDKDYFGEKEKDEVRTWVWHDYNAAIAASPSSPEVREVMEEEIARTISQNLKVDLGPGDCGAAATAVLRLLAPSDQDVTGE